MTNEARIRAFADAVDQGNPPWLEDLYEQALLDGIPVIRRDTQSFLRTLLALQKPKTILEAGTAVGFSALLMAACTEEDCRITTIENYEKRIPLARKNFENAGLDHRITLIEGDAGEVLKTLDGSFCHL